MGKSKLNLTSCTDSLTLAQNRTILRARKVRNALTVKDRLKVIEMLKNNESQRAIAI